MNVINNKKGFTLVELLAVIVILAVIVLVASSGVLSNMDRARKGVLATEGTTLVDSAKNAFQFDILDGKITGTSAVCYKLQYLHDQGYFSKGSADKYTGSVLISPSNGGKTVEYTFWISNGSYVITGKPGTTGTAAENGTAASENCGNASGAQLIQS